MNNDQIITGSDKRIFKSGQAAPHVNHTPLEVQRAGRGGWVGGTWEGLHSY